MAIRYGASALGLVSQMPSGPGVIDLKEIRAIASNIPPGVGSFLLTSSTNPEKIISQHHYCRTSVIQLVARLEKKNYQKLKVNLPGIRLVQVIHVENENALDEAMKLQDTVDALLLDSGKPNAKTPELGGTGRTHNWDISRKIVAGCRVPVYLAGGLTPKNAADAIASVQPFGLDVCSGVRSEGTLDEIKLAAFTETLDKGNSAKFD